MAGGPRGRGARRGGSRAESLIQPQSALSAESESNLNSLPFHDHPQDQDRSTTQTSATLEARGLSLEPLNLHIHGTPATRSDRSDSSHTQAGDLDAVGAGIKALINTIQKLEGLGLGSLEIPIPKVVVLGDQSAGKSSLLEAISHIKFPRAGGTCTRCPLFVKLSPNGDRSMPWKARVYIRKTFQIYANGTSRSSRTTNPFYEWKRGDLSTQIEFATTESKDDLGEIIFRAQIATCMPGSDTLDFVTANLPVSGNALQLQYDFSPNVVCIEISDFDLPNLSFYDLPGIINQVGEKGKEHLPKLVTNVVKEYVQDNDALVLLACSMENDPQTWNAPRVARECKAENRCIGVLTKPDRLARGSPLHEFDKILSGTSYSLGHGYFVTKQPSQDELANGLTNAEAREREEQFFNSEEPWASTFAHHRNRFGTLNLREFLSTKLASHALRALPTIREKITSKLDQVESQLKLIPAPPTQNALGVVSSVLQNFALRMTKEMDGEGLDNTWRLIWNARKEWLSKSLESLKPSLITRAILDKNLYRGNGAQLSSSASTSNDCIILDSEDEEETPCLVPQAVTPKKRKYETPPDSVATPSTRGRSSKSDASAKHPLAKKFQLDEVRKVLNDLSASKLPGEIDPKALDHLIYSTLEHWNEPTAQFIRQLEDALRARTLDIFNDEFQQWNSTELFRRSWQIVEEFMLLHIGEQSVAATEALADERVGGPHIGSQEWLEYNRTKVSAMYKDARYNARFKVYMNEWQESSAKQLGNADRDKAGKDPAVRTLLSTDPYQREVEALSKVRAYYEVASTRFKDHICMRVQSKLFKSLRDDLRDELISGLQIYEAKGSEKCYQLLVADAEKEREREELEKKKAALLQGQKCLDDLDNEYKDTTTSHLPDGLSSQTTSGYSFSNDDMECDA